MRHQVIKHIRVYVVRHGGGEYHDRVSDTMCKRVSPAPAALAAAPAGAVLPAIELTLSGVADYVPNEYVECNFT